MNMDAQESSDNQGKKNTEIRVVQSGGGSNIGGLVVVVGALAVAGLVRVVAPRIKKRRDANENRVRGEEEESKGLPSILLASQQSPHQNQCCKSYDSAKTVTTRKDSVEMQSTKSLILEENLVLGLDERDENPICGNQEVLIQASTLASIGQPQPRDGSDRPEELPPDGCFQPGMDDKLEYDSGDKSVLTGVREAVKAEELIDIENGGKKKTPFQSVPEEEGAGSRDEHDIIEKMEELADGAGCSSAESICGAILLPHLPPASEATMEDLQVVQEKIVKEGMTAKEETNQLKGSSCTTFNNLEEEQWTGEDPEIFHKGKALELTAVNGRAEHKLKTGIWIWSLLGLMLMCYYCLPVTTACLIVLLITVLSLYEKI